MLLAIPNVSEGRDERAIEAIGAAFDARLLGIHSDPDHHRSVFTLAGTPGSLAGAVLSGAAEVVRRIDLERHEGIHPRVGAIDVAPVVYLDPADRGAACAEALVLGDLLGHELELPVFLYGELAQGRTRAELRRGGPANLARRIEAGELRPDFGPRRLHPRAGAVLVAARPPLVAFNVELAPPATVDDARAIAARIRDGGPEGLSGVRAIAATTSASGKRRWSSTLVDTCATPRASSQSPIARRPGRPSGPPSRIAAAIALASATVAGAASSTLNATSGGRAATSTAPALG